MARKFIILIEKLIQIRNIYVQAAKIMKTDIQAHTANVSILEKRDSRSQKRRLKEEANVKTDDMKKYKCPICNKYSFPSLEGPGCLTCSHNGYKYLWKEVGKNYFKAIGCLLPTLSPLADRSE